MVEQMKPSGIDWIGDIPVRWETSKIKYNIGLIGSGTTPESGNPLYYEDGKYNWIQSGDLYKTDYIFSTEKQLTALAIKDNPALTYYGKDFVVIAMYGASVGNVSISKIDAYTNQACCVIKAKNNDDIRYLFYYLKAAQDEMLLKAFGGTQPNISQIIIKNLNCLKIPAAEQKRISDYLDFQCGKIDGIISDLEKQIETLQKYKMSLITETVTKGLDKSATMKDSRVSIIGKIKANWEIKKLKYIVSTPITDGPHETPVLLDDGIPFLSAESVKNGVLDFDYKRGYISEIDHRVFCKKIKPQKGDIFVVKSGATTGNVGRVTTDEEFSIWSPLALIRCDNKTILQDFIYYCTLSNYFRQEVELSWSYGTQQNIGMGVLGNLNIVIPPAAEQAEIVKFLDDKCGKIDSILKDKQEQLEKIKQHKKSLIYEYVTGKKRVKEAINGN